MVMVVMAVTVMVMVMIDVTVVTSIQSHHGIRYDSGHTAVELQSSIVNITLTIIVCVEIDRYVMDCL